MSSLLTRIPRVQQPRVAMPAASHVHRFAFIFRERSEFGDDGAGFACMCIGAYLHAGAATHGARTRAHTDVGKESVGYTHDVAAGPTTGARDCIAGGEGGGESSGPWWRGSRGR